MTFERWVANLFAMDETTWLRHAHPGSVISRNTVLPLLIIAFWSRLWIGWWALFPVFLALLWAWINPRIFPVPSSLDHWTSQGVLGERVWLNRDQIPVPEHHRIVPHLLSAISGIGMLFVVWGVAVLDPWPTLLGATVVYVSKWWFLDRMVWIWKDMQDATEEYRRWQTRMR
jgi:hypothetical protein